MTPRNTVSASIASLPSVLAAYEAGLNDAATELAIKGKILEHAQRDHISHLAYYAERHAELKSLLKYMDLRVSEVRGSLIRRFIENHSRQLGDRLLNNYVDAEPDYLAAYKLMLDVQEMTDKYGAVVDAFEKRGFLLRDITTARVHDVHGSQI